MAKAPLEHSLCGADIMKRIKISKVCLICSGECDQNEIALSQIVIKNIKDNAKKWVGLNKYNDVYNRVSSDSKEEMYVHHTCKMNMASKKRLDAEKLRGNKVTLDVSNVDIEIDNNSSISSNVTRRSSGPIHKPNLCIWCLKPKDVRHADRDTSVLHCIEYKSSWEQFKSHTIHLEDTNMRSRLVNFIDSCNDPFAVEIRYHPNCWRRYVNYSETTIPLQGVKYEEVKIMIINHVNDVIFVKSELRTLASLLYDFNQLLRNFNLKPCERTGAFKQILQDEFGERIGFHEGIQKNVSWTVYDKSKSDTLMDAALFSFGVTDEQLLNNAAKRLKLKLMGVSNINWPPFPNDLETHNKSNQLLNKFLIWLRNPHEKDIKDNTSAQVSAISEILQAYMTGKRTLFQTQLAITIHGLTRSKELLTLLHKFGLTISYKDTIDLEAAWACNESEKNPICPEELRYGYPGIAIIDNDDFREDTLTGGGTSHRTNMMFLQSANLEMPKDINSQEILKFATKEKKEELASPQKYALPYKTVKRGNPIPCPNFNTDLISCDDQRNRSFLHAFVRLPISGEELSPSEQTIGAYSGFQANIYDRSEKSKAYYYFTHSQPPKKTVVHEMMCRCIAAADHKDMPFIQLVGDQPVYALILEIKNEDPSKFSRIMPVLGGFHTQGAFMSTINKRFEGSGLFDLVSSTAVVEEGSADQALRGGHHNRGMRTYMLVYEALIRMLIQNQQSKLPQKYADIIEKVIDIPGINTDVSQNKKRKTLTDLLLDDTDFSNYIGNMINQIEVSSSDMGKYWLSFLEMVEILLMHYHAMRTQNWKEYLISIRLMLPWMAIYDSLHYTRYLSIYWAQMNNLTIDKRWYMEQGMFASSMSELPFSSVPYDQWIEMKMNKGSKMKGGWIGITNNESQLHIHTKTVNFISKVRESLHERASLNSVTRHHTANSKSRLKIDEQIVQDLIRCLNEWESNPWEEDKVLCSLESGLLASVDLISDFNSAKKDGSVLVNQYFEERIKTSEKKIIDRIKQNKRCTFQKPPEEAAKTNPTNKTDSMENRAMISLVQAAQKSALDLQSVMQYRLTEVPLSLFHLNGTIKKAQKSKLLESFKFDISHEVENYVSIIDMGFLWRASTPNKEDRESYDGSHLTWSDYAEKIFLKIMQRHPNATEFHFINDRYDVGMTIKDAEHQRRSSLYSSGSRNIFPKANQILPTSSNFNAFFTNSKNKVRLQKFLKEEFQRLARTKIERFYYTLGDSCYNLKTGEIATEYNCQHEEADTRIFYHAFIRQSVLDIPVVIDAEDTDVVCIAIQYAQSSLGCVFLYRRGRMYNCKEICSPEVSTIIIQLHAFTGCDTVSGFFGHSKKTAFEKVDNYSYLLEDLGRNLNVTKKLSDDLETFTIKVIYNDKISKTLAEARAKKWNSMVKKGTLRLAPDKDSFNQHLNRANYQCYIWLNYHNPNSPSSPLLYGWELMLGIIVPVMYTNPALPADISSILHTVQETNLEIEPVDLSDNEELE